MNPIGGIAPLAAKAGCNPGVLAGYSAPEGAEAMRDDSERRQTRPHFANARSIRNPLDRARLRQARRLCGGWSGAVDPEALVTIQAEDIRARRVFSGDSNDQ